MGVDLSRDYQDGKVAYLCSYYCATVLVCPVTNIRKDKDENESKRRADSCQCVRFRSVPS